MAVGGQLAIKVFREGFLYFKYCITKSKSSLFSKRQLVESHLHIADYGDFEAIRYFQQQFRESDQS